MCKQQFHCPNSPDLTLLQEVGWFWKELEIQHMMLPIAGFPQSGKSQ